MNRVFPRGGVLTPEAAARGGSSWRLVLRCRWPLRPSNASKHAMRFERRARAECGEGLVPDSLFPRLLYFQCHWEAASLGVKRTRALIAERVISPEGKLHLLARAEGLPPWWEERWPTKRALGLSRQIQRRGRYSDAPSEEVCPGRHE